MYIWLQYSLTILSLIAATQSGAKRDVKGLILMLSHLDFPSAIVKSDAFAVQQYTFASVGQVVSICEVGQAALRAPLATGCQNSARLFGAEELPLYLSLYFHTRLLARVVAWLNFFNLQHGLALSCHFLGNFMATFESLGLCKSTRWCHQSRTFIFLCTMLIKYTQMTQH